MRSNVSHWERSAGQDEHIGVVMLVVLAGAVLFGVFFFFQMSSGLRPPSVDVLGARSEAAQRPGSGYRPPAVAAPAQPAEQIQVQAAPQVQVQPTVQATAAPATATAHVAHTDGVGVVLRSSPKDSDRLPRGFMDGAEVTVLERQGTDWVHVRGPSNQEGWIPARYLDQ